MTEIGAYEAKTHLADLLGRVERGEHFTITRHGQPVAELRPVAARPLRDLAELRTAAAQLRADVAERQGPLTRDEIAEAIATGRA